MTPEQRIARLERDVQDLNYAIHALRTDLDRERTHRATDAYSRITLPLTEQPPVTGDPDTGELRIEEQ